MGYRIHRTRRPVSSTVPPHTAKILQGSWGWRNARNGRTVSLPSRARPRATAVEISQSAEDPEERHSGIERVKFGQALPYRPPSGQGRLAEDVLINDSHRVVVSVRPRWKRVQEFAKFSQHDVSRTLRPALPEPEAAGAFQRSSAANVHARVLGKGIQSAPPFRPSAVPAPIAARKGGSQLVVQVLGHADSTSIVMRQTANCISAFGSSRCSSSKPSSTNASNNLGRSTLATTVPDCISRTSILDWYIESSQLSGRRRIPV